MYKLLVENFAKSVATVVVEFDCKSDADNAYVILTATAPALGTRSVTRLY